MKNRKEHGKLGDIFGNSTDFGLQLHKIPIVTKIHWTRCKEISFES